MAHFWSQGAQYYEHLFGCSRPMKGLWEATKALLNSSKQGQFTIDGGPLRVYPSGIICCHFIDFWSWLYLQKRPLTCHKTKKLYSYLDHVKLSLGFLFFRSELLNGNFINPALRIHLYLKKKMLWLILATRTGCIESFKVWSSRSEQIYNIMINGHSAMYHNTTVPWLHSAIVPYYYSAIIL